MSIAESSTNHVHHAVDLYWPTEDEPIQLINMRRAQAGGAFTKQHNRMDFDQPNVKEGVMLSWEDKSTAVYRALEQLAPGGTYYVLVVIDPANGFRSQIAREYKFVQDLANQYPPRGLNYMFDLQPSLGQGVINHIFELLRQTGFSAMLRVFIDPLSPQDIEEIDQCGWSDWFERT